MLKEAVKVDEKSTQTRYALGWVYYKKNVFSRAIVYLKEPNDKIQNNPMIRYHLGMAYHKNGEKENAKRELKKALELDPKFQGSEETKEVLSKLK
jgi:tetratricopeptide (TPR) repeat protein